MAVKISKGTKKTIIDSLLLVIVSPAIIFGLETLAHFLATYSASLYDQLHIAYYILIIILFSLMELLLQRISASKGDIVNLKELESKHIVIRPLMDSLIMFINVALTFFIALPLGQEGPSVFLIASMAIFFFRNDASPDYDDSIDIGAAMGYGLAFYNPLAGLCFGYEAMKRKFSWKSFLHLLIMMTAAYLLLLVYRASYNALITGSWNFSFEPSLFENGLVLLGNSYEWMMLVFFGPLLYLLAFLFNRLCAFFRPMFVRGTFMSVVIAFSFSVILVCAARSNGFDYLLGAGSSLIDGETLLPLETAIYALVVRILFSSWAFSFPHAGGQAVPTLVIGALIGTVYGYVSAILFPAISHNAIAIYTIVGAIAFYGSSTTYTITAFSLIFSFGNPLALFAPALLVTSQTFLLQKLCRRPSLEKLLHRVDKENRPEKERMSISFR